MNRLSMNPNHKMNSGELNSRKSIGECTATYNEVYHHRPVRKAMREKEGYKYTEG